MSSSYKANTKVGSDFTWKPISEELFKEVLDEEERDLPESLRKVYEQFHVPVVKMKLKRRLLASDELAADDVFVVAKTDQGVIYYDDVEHGLEFSTLDEDGFVWETGAGNRSLSELVYRYLLPHSDGQN